ncbi:MAG TPA: hypothetical protein VLC48_01200, partial [Gemmatimonadota bacterium]|nr:hypothetical protein [Gemmatimonadota bacterium]
MSSGGGNGGARVLPQADGAPQPAEVSSLKLLLTLGLAGAMAGLLIVFVYQLTQPRIQAYKAMKLREAVSEVLAAPARWDTLYVYDGALTLTPPVGIDVRSLEMVFLGYRADSSRVGYAIQGAEAGFQDII